MFFSLNLSSSKLFEFLVFVYFLGTFPCFIVCIVDFDVLCYTVSWFEFKISPTGSSVWTLNGHLALESVEHTTMPSSILV